MKEYVKPIVLANNELSEGVYTASGTIDNGPKCDSIHMNGNFRAPDLSALTNSSLWTQGYQNLFGCLGCPSCVFDWWGHVRCDLTHGVNNNNDRYDGKRKPYWEKKGYDPNATIADTNWQSNFDD